MVLLSLGYQLHFSISSTPIFQRFAKPDDLQWPLPVFWIGFNIAMFPVSLIVKHRGGLIVMGAAGLLGAAAIYMAETAGALNTLIAAQFVAGAAWGCMLMSAVSATIAIGDDGAEGKLSGWCSRRLRWRPLRGCRQSRAAYRSCRTTRRCCTGRRSPAGRSPAPGFWRSSPRECRARGASKLVDPHGEEARTAVSGRCFASLGEP
jgi:hypothetical protein